MLLIPKTEPLRKPEYLIHLRGVPCVVTGSVGENDPHHVKLGWFAKSIKPPDDWCLPLRHDKHVELHNVGEAAFWREAMKDKQTLGHILRLAAKGLYLEWLNGR